MLAHANARNQSRDSGNSNRAALGYDYDGTDAQLQYLSERKSRRLNRLAQRKVHGRERLSSMDR